MSRIEQGIYRVRFAAMPQVRVKMLPDKKRRKRRAEAAFGRVGFST
jgi:hypothetical protein